MTPRDLSALHKAAFTQERGWEADEFADLLGSPLVRLHHRPNGFALSRTVAGESELLTLAVHPAHRRRGLGHALVALWLEEVTGHSDAAFLEVAADNVAAIALYKAAGFAQDGLRRAYYKRPGAPDADAILMRKQLTRRQPADSPHPTPESG